MAEDYADTGPPRKRKARRKIRATAVLKPPKRGRMPKIAPPMNENYDPEPIRESIRSFIEQKKEGVRPFERKAGITEGRLRHFVVPKKPSGELTRAPGLDAVVLGARYCNVTVSEFIGEVPLSASFEERVAEAVAERLQQLPPSQDEEISALKQAVVDLSLENSRLKQELARAIQRAREESARKDEHQAQADRVLKGARSRRGSGQDEDP